MIRALIALFLITPSLALQASPARVESKALPSAQAPDANKRPIVPPATRRAVVHPPARPGGEVQARLIEIYKLVGQGGTRDFTSVGKTMEEWTPALQAEVQQLLGRDIKLKEVSYLSRTDSSDTMVLTFGELINGASRGSAKRQYGASQGSQRKIFFEGPI